MAPPCATFGTYSSHHEPIRASWTSLNKRKTDPNQSTTDVIQQIEKQRTTKKAKLKTTSVASNILSASQPENVANDSEYLINGNVIHVKKKLFNRADEILRKAIQQFTNPVHLKVDPFGMQTIFFCYKDVSGKIISMTIDTDDAIVLESVTINKNDRTEIDSFTIKDDSMRKTLAHPITKIKEIKSDPTYQKINVEFNLK